MNALDANFCKACSMHNFFVFKKAWKFLSISIYCYILVPAWILFCSAPPSSFLEYLNKPHRHSHNHTLPLPLALTKPMAAIGWCPSECAKLHLLVPYFFAHSRKWGIINPIPDADRAPAEITGLFAWFSCVPKLLFSAFPLLFQQLLSFPSVNSRQSCSLPSALALRSNRLKRQRLLNPQCQDMEQDHLFSGSHTSTDCSRHGLGGLIPTQDSAGLQRICSYEVFPPMSSFVFDNQNQSPTKVSPPNFSL